MIPYSIVRTDHHWSSIGKLMFAIACIALGWILASSYNIGLDAHICPWWPDQGVNTGLSADRWRK